MKFERIAFAGSGNVAIHLANAFTQAGKDVCCFLNRSSSDSLHLVGGKMVQRTISVATFIETRPDIIIIAVSDKEIFNVSAQLAHAHIPMVHTSGAVSILDIQHEGQPVGVFYPLQTLRAGMLVIIATPMKATAPMWMMTSQSYV